MDIVERRTFACAKNYVQIRCTGDAFAGCHELTGMDWRRFQLVVSTFVHILPYVPSQKRWGGKRFQLLFMSN